MFKHVSVELTQARIRTPVTDLLFNMCGEVKKTAWGTSNDKNWVSACRPSLYTRYRLVSWPLSMIVFWIVTPCRLIGRHRRFGGIYCLHLQVWYLPKTPHGFTNQKALHRHLPYIFKSCSYRSVVKVLQES
jgi:hypothetical protein